MPAVEGLRSPYDKSAGGLRHLGRMFDKMRLKQAGKLPPDFERNYGLSFGLDGILCGFLGVKFEDIEARVQAGGADAEIVEWVFSHGLRPSKTQAVVWNEYIRKLGWNDRGSAVLAKAKAEGGYADRHDVVTILDGIEVSEGREPPAQRS
ncbi:MAG: DUF5069 domain-containing protein [Opitutae bacterium]|nr:DUF5069 domain-containing protein [Opitutae bacterium]